MRDQLLKIDWMKEITSNGDGVFWPMAGNGAWAVVDFEGLSVRLISVRLLAVEFGVDLAGNWGDGAGGRGNPKVGWTSVENDGEDLRGSADVDFSVVLSIHVVVDLNLRPVGEEFLGLELSEEILDVSLEVVHTHELLDGGLTNLRDWHCDKSHWERKAKSQYDSGLHFYWARWIQLPFSFIIMLQFSRDLRVSFSFYRSLCCQ